MKRISLKAVVISALTILALDILGGLVMLSVLGRHFFHDGMSSKQLNEAVMAVTRSTTFLIGAIIVGTTTTIIGGYISARISKKDAYLNAGIVGLAGVILGIILADESPMWFNVIGLVTAIPAALLGGYMGRARSTVNA